MNDKELAPYVDASAFSLDEWRQSIHIVENWLEANSKISDLDTILGFIGCCAEMAEKQPGMQYLPSVVEDYLSLHGFAGGIDRD